MAYLIFSLTGAMLLFKDLSLPTEVKSADANFEISVAGPMKSADHFLAYQEVFAHWQQHTPDGKLLAIYPAQEEQERFLVLHKELFLGSWGKIYLGFVGILYLILLSSGFVLYGRFMSFRRFASLRVSTLFKVLDWHKLLGVVTWAWSVLVAFTGTMLAFNSLGLKIFQAQILRQLQFKYSLLHEGLATSSVADLGRVYQEFKKLKPQAWLDYLVYPDTEFGLPGHFLILYHELSANGKKVVEVMVSRAQDAGFTEIIGVPWYLKMMLLSEPLHFADYGGWKLNVFWLLMTLASMTVVILGVLAFLSKKFKWKWQLSPEDRRIRGAKERTYFQHYFWPMLLSILVLLAVLIVFLLQNA